jgi:hypothetical protein
MRRFVAMSLLVFVASASSLVTTAPALASGPTLIITSPAAGATVSGAVTASADAIDPDGIHKVRFWAGPMYLGYDTTAPYSKSWDTMLSVNGQRTLKVEALDLLGNSTVATITVTVANLDSVAPAVSVISPSAGGNVAGTFNISAYASDNIAVQKVRFWAGATYLGYDGSLPFEKAWNSRLKPNGPVLLKVEALDNANNVSVVTVVVTVANVDPVPPSVSITAPAEGPLLSGTVPFTATASDDVALHKVRFWIDETYLGYDMSSPYEKSWDTTMTWDGAHILKVEALDNAGNSVVETRAVTVNNTPLGHLGVVPLMVGEETLSTWESGVLFTLTYDSTSVGHLVPIRIDGSSASTYASTAMHGSSQVTCAASTLRCDTGVCPGTYPSVCAETSPECDGPECTFATGNLVGPTRDAVDFRMDNTSDSCDTFAEAFAGPDAGGNFTVTAGCDPNGGGGCTTATSVCSRRIFVLTVGDDSAPGTILGFVTVYLEGYGSCGGSVCEIQGRFVNTMFP